MTPPAPSISVLIPTHDRRDLVGAAIESVLAQRHPALEVIVVDDGSTDGTADVLAAFGTAIRVVRQVNAGVAAARDAGVAVARGEVIAFLDSDDRWLSHHLTTLVAAFGRHPEAVLVSAVHGFRSGPGWNPRAAALAEPLPRMLVGNLVGFPSCTAVRRDALLAAGGFRAGMEPCEAYDLWLRMATLGPFAFVRRRTVARERLPDSVSAGAIAAGRFLPRRAGIDVASHADAGRAYAAWVAALQALDREDDAAAAGALRVSCTLAPERSQEPWLVIGWLGLLQRATTPEGALATNAWLAEAWPDQRSPTAAGLRLRAAGLAMHARRPRLAGRLLRGVGTRDLIRAVAALVR